MLKSLKLIVIVLVMSAAAANAQNKTPDTKVGEPSTKVVKKANQRPTPEPVKTEPFEKASVETMAKQCVRFETESGVIDFEMFPESAPESVRNFLNLAAIGAFDTTVFSRIVPGFVIQGGDLYTRSKMTTELDKRARRTIPDEPSQIKHDRGILSMARSDEPNTASTHFFILLREANTLDGKFAAFGRVVKGMEVVEAINKMPVEGEKPTKPVHITRAAVAACQAQ